jgi:hypothetical protein
MIVTNTTLIGAAPTPTDAYEALTTRRRDLALVDFDALCAGASGREAAALVGAYAEDVTDALREARARLAELRKELAGPDPLNILEATSRQRASDAGHAGATRVRERLVRQAEAARAMGRLADLAAALVPKLFEAERRR